MSPRLSLASVLGSLLALGCVNELIFLEQNWSQSEREEFWFTPQGSKILPYEWFLNLEAPSGGELFATRLSKGGYGYLPADKGAANPDGLPVGFVRDGEDLGLTCAGCHTNDVQVGRKTIRIDGAPALANLGAFLSDLTIAVRLAAEDDTRFARFAARMDSSDASLREELQTLAQRLVQQEERNRPLSPAGHGRTDAFGEIFNAVLAEALDIPENAATPNAPVSYPALWDTPHHKRLQWNGSAHNVGPGPLIRNAGEVLGVFGKVTVDPEEGPGAKSGGYASSVNFENLARLEEMLKEIWSPEWPSDLLGEPDSDDVAAGAKLYKGCKHCHQPIDRSDPARQANEFLAYAFPGKPALGTDTTLLEQAARTADPGKLKGKQVFFGLGECAPQRECLDSSPAGGFGILGNVVIGALYAGYPDASDFEKELQLYRGAVGRAASDAAMGKDAKKYKHVGQPAGYYKARPLNGIWATAPYLHNGSVPSLWQLLTPGEKRIRLFKVGSRKFDPDEVGFAYDLSEEGSLVDTRLRGNSNRGHKFGTTLLDEEKWQLIAYLKTL